MAKPKVNLHALSELKNTSDDMIAPYLTSRGFRQSHTLADVRLAIGFTACAIAAGTFYLDYTSGFEAAKSWTLYAVIAYFVLNTALTYWMMFVEGGKVFVGVKEGVKVTISTHTEKHSPVYHVKVLTDAPGMKETNMVKRKSAFTNWFDQEGCFVEKPFKAFLEDSIPLLAAKTQEGTALLKAKGKGSKKA